MVYHSRDGDALETEYESKSGLGYGYDPSRKENHHHILAGIWSAYRNIKLRVTKADQNGNM